MCKLRRSPLLVLAVVMATSAPAAHAATTPTASELAAQARGEEEIQGQTTVAPVIPAPTVTQPSLLGRYSPDVPYYNITRSRVNLREGPTTGTRVVAQLRPGQGGYLERCDLSGDWCLINYGGQGAQAWVYMQLMGSAAN